MPRHQRGRRGAKKTAGRKKDGVGRTLGKAKKRLFQRKFPESGRGGKTKEGGRQKKEEG